MELNDDAGYRNEHGALTFFASRLAPTMTFVLIYDRALTPEGRR
ncbi:MAG: hypothetical protein JWP42_2555 [Pseudomonas sp.]|nr:hypothetical protein [Pseudomonas sp.]